VKHVLAQSTHGYCGIASIDTDEYLVPVTKEGKLTTLTAALGESCPLLSLGFVWFERSRRHGITLLRSYTLDFPAFRPCLASTAALGNSSAVPRQRHAATRPSPLPSWPPLPSVSRV